MAAEPGDSISFLFMDDSDLVVIATFTYPSEAEVAASVLDAEGIDSLIERPFIAGARRNWLFGDSSQRSVRLLVRAGDAERAREALDPGSSLEIP